MPRKPALSHTIIKQIEFMLKESVIEFSYYDRQEVVSVFTENKLAEKFRLEITYATNAYRNGNQPIIYAFLHSANNYDIDLSDSIARQILRMCYHKSMEGRI